MGGLGTGAHRRRTMESVIRSGAPPPTVVTAVGGGIRLRIAAARSLLGSSGVDPSIPSRRHRAGLAPLAVEVEWTSISVEW